MESDDDALAALEERIHRAVDLVTTAAAASNEIVRELAAAGPEVVIAEQLDVP